MIFALPLPWRPLPGKMNNNGALDSASRLRAASRYIRLARSSRVEQRFSLSCLVLVAFAACEPPAITTTGVIGIFGELGLGPGAFSYPRAITTAADGSVFVVDKNGRVQRFSADGEFETFWRMPDTAQGKPVGLTVHPDGRIFVADTHYHRVSIFDRDGKLLGTFGQEGTGDGQFLLPTDVAVDARGFIYVREYMGIDCITKWSPQLQFIAVLGDQPIDGNPLSRPDRIDIDDDQTLWIADSCNHRIVRLSLEGEVLTTFGRFCDEPGEMRYPYDISISPEGRVLVCEYEGNRLQWFSKAGRSLRTWGCGGRNPGELSAPWGATYGPNGMVYVVDSLNQRVQIIKP